MKNNKKKLRNDAVRDLLRQRRRREGNSAQSAVSAKKSEVAVKAVAPLSPEATRALQWLRMAALPLFGLVFLWAYWPTLVELVRIWDREPDYSHGFLVAPLSLFFLWARRDRLPPVRSGLAWPGLFLLLAAGLIRWAAAAFYVDALDGWSIAFWVGGVVWLLYGWQVFSWALPAIAFLWFAVPLPFRAERLLSHPLQGIATRLSSAAFQILGQPAIAEGHTILLGNHQMAIEEACSGLRIFMSIIALAFAYIIVVRRAWWEKCLLLISTIPIALSVNAFRIVITGLLYQYVSGEAAAKFSHDLAGWVMIVVAASMFGLVLWYVGNLFREVERWDMPSAAISAKVQQS